MSQGPGAAGVLPGVPGWRGGGPCGDLTVVGGALRAVAAVAYVGMLVLATRRRAAPHDQL